MHKRTTLFTLLLLVAMPAGKAAAQDAGVDFFEKKIRPVLVEHCYSCHSSGPKKLKGGLALDTRAAVRKGGESGPAVVLGKPGDSLLIKAVRYTDQELRMPPKGKLSAEVIADLEKWVALGAPDPRSGGVVVKDKGGPGLEEGRKRWAFQVPRKQPLPVVKDTSWARSPIDRFLLGKMEEKALRPAADASRADLLRRAYFALVGLPPTPEEIDAFVNDRAADAYVRVVDRLLASPRFGERWGRHWLDVARYAESSGGGRSLLFKDAWRYRDYVIQSFNTDKPFDRFLTEQVAGDLLPHDDPQQRYEQLVATAFLLLGPINYESQDKPVLEMDIIDEQLDTLGKGVLGMTIGCARCHDHKFDPIPHKDYYALAGILKNTKVVIHENVSRWTEQPLPMSPGLELAVNQHEAAVAVLKDKIRVAKATEKNSGKGTAVATGPVALKDLSGIVLDDADAKKVGHWKHSKFSNNYIGEGYLYDDRGAKEEKTLTFVPDFPRSGVYEVRLAYVPSTNRATNVPVRIFHADGEVTLKINQRKTPSIDGHFVSLGKYRFEQGNQWFVMVATDGADGHVIADAVQFLPEAAVVETKPARIKSGPVPAPMDLKALEAELKRLTAKAPDRPMAMSVFEGEKIADCHLCIRGNFHNPGPKVPRGFLQILTSAEASAAAKFAIGPKESGRRQLAAWLTSPDNPLTARVMANRVWHHLFGTGLVRTVDNFGIMGEAPSHPELLDYLAVRFVEEGWSVKKLIREIMLSHAYQMSTEGDQETTRRAAKADPENRLLWHMNRRRLDAESIRDTILSVGGNLDCNMGGSTLKKGVVERDYRFEDTRRSVYTPVLRNRLLEFFEVFDFADPNFCLGRRNVSTVATQALYLMNSPFIAEQSRKAAQALLSAPELDDAGRMDRAYRLALGRLPNARERQLALTFLGQAATAQQREDLWAEVYQTLFACVDFRYVN